MTSQFLFKLTREVATWLTLALVMCACGVSAIPEAAPAAVPDVDGSAALTSPCEPGPSEIALFTDGDFGEPCAIRGIGEYPHSGGNADQMGLEGDTPSSIKVGADVEAVLCTDGNFGGICQKFTTDNAHLGDEKVHDDVTSLKVRQRGYLACVPNADQVALFSHADFVEPCKLKGTNGYTDQAFSSLIVGANMDAILCTYYIGSRCAGYKAFEPEKFSPIYAPAGTLWIEKRGSQSCVPRVNEVALFEFPGSFGPCVVLGVGDYQHSYEMELANDTLASILVGESVQAILCTDANFEGECSDPVTSDNTSLYLGRYYNVGVSSLQVQWRGGCIPNAEQVVLFKDANYHPPCVIKGIGSYHNASEIGLPYHSISSVRVGSSIQLCACKEENFGGSCDVVGTTPSLDSDYQSG
ncbi:hypothetical protein KDA23_04190, partial [Candidatus Saccharibacteria bacterium]|nr:hypothetical protein [Candidatus Saccharibacteria bacterium]